MEEVLVVPGIYEYDEYKEVVVKNRKSNSIGITKRCTFKSGRFFPVGIKVKLTGVGENNSDVSILIAKWKWVKGQQQGNFVIKYAGIKT